MAAKRTCKNLLCPRGPPHSAVPKALENVRISHDWVLLMNKLERVVSSTCCVSSLKKMFGSVVNVGFARTVGKVNLFLYSKDVDGDAALSQIFSKIHPIQVGRRGNCEQNFYVTVTFQ